MIALPSDNLAISACAYHSALLQVEMCVLHADILGVTKFYSAPFGTKQQFETTRQQRADNQPVTAHALQCGMPHTAALQHTARQLAHLDVCFGCCSRC